MRILSLACFTSLLAIAGCGTPPASMVDAAVPDAFVPVDVGIDAFVPIPTACDPAELNALTGVLGDTVSIDLDTTTTETRPLDLGLRCGNTSGEIRWAHQEVVEFTVPGTGPVGVQFTALSGTQLDFNTVVQVRRECSMVPAESFPPSCFDDASATEVRSVGGVQAMGGDTLYFFVTGYSDPPASMGTVDEGTIHLEFTVEANSPPTLTSGSAVFAGAETVITLEASDAEGPIVGYVMSFYTAAGRLDIFGDGVADENDVLTLSFESVDTAGMDYTGHDVIRSMTEYTIAAYCRAVGCTELGFRVFDAGYAGSAELRVMTQEAAFVGLGGACDSTHLCAGGLVCTGAMCVVTPAAAAACGAAMELAVPTPTTTATSLAVRGTVPAGTGIFGSTCGMTPGRESIWHLAVPAGHYDLRLTTDVAGTAAGTDTVLYVRSVCADSSTQLPMGCNDDIDTASMRYHSQLAFQDIAEGDYFIFIETYNGATAAYGLSATLVPVLDPGIACDPMALTNRCATGACPAGASPVCP